MFSACHPKEVWIICESFIFPSNKRKGGEKDRERRPLNTKSLEIGRNKEVSRMDQTMQMRLSNCPGPDWFSHNPVCYAQRKSSLVVVCPSSYLQLSLSAGPGSMGKVICVDRHLAGLCLLDFQCSRSFRSCIVGSIHVTAARDSTSLCHESHLVRSRGICPLTDAGRDQCWGPKSQCSRDNAVGKKTEKHVPEGAFLLQTCFLIYNQDFPPDKSSSFPPWLFIFTMRFLIILHECQIPETSTGQLHLRVLMKTLNVLFSKFTWRPKASDLAPWPLCFTSQCTTKGCLWRVPVLRMPDA